MEIHHYRSYHDFLIWMDELVQNHMTSGENQSEKYVQYTQLNHSRMKRIVKTLTLNQNVIEAIGKLPIHMNWVLITEAWCGDSAQTLPVIGKIAEISNDKINLKIIGRDEHPEWINQYTTNGSKSIPKLIAFDENNKEVFVWGPRPVEAQKILIDWKVNPNGRTKEDFELELHTWYAKDKTISVQNELADLLNQVNNHSTKHTAQV
jgi:thioredoxin-like negative regulator of GroEL